MHLAPYLDIINYLYLLIPLVLISQLLTLPVVRGWLGERKVNHYLRRNLGPDYRLLTNLTLPTADGTTQIDHLLVSPYGLFVIETKNMSGWIFGGARQKQWTRKYYRHTQRFQNPLHQNYKHTQTLQTLLELASTQLHSIVVFVGNNEFKTELPGNVLRLAALADYIEAFQTVIISAAEQQAIVKTLERVHKPETLRTHREHVAHLRERKARSRPSPPPEAPARPPVTKPAPTESAPEVAAPRCLHCGSAMVRRTVRRGERAGSEFWGCCQYPKCRGTR